MFIAYYELFTIFLYKLTYSALTENDRSRIANRMPTGTLVPPEGFWRAPGIFRMFIWGLERLFFNFPIICHTLAIIPVEPVCIADARIQS